MHTFKSVIAGRKTRSRATFHILSASNRSQLARMCVLPDSHRDQKEVRPSMAVLKQTVQARRHGKLSGTSRGIQAAFAGSALQY